MKKAIIITVVIIFLLIGGIYGLLFTTPGNNILKGIIEKKLQEKLPLNVKIKQFKLTPSFLKLNINFGKNSLFNIEGDISIFSQNFDLKYLIKIKELSQFEKLINYKLNGNFFTEGKIKGSKESININGITNIADSQSVYNINLKNYEISKIALDFKKIHIDKLLYMLNYPQIANGFIDLTGNLKDININNLTFNGKLNTIITKGNLIAKVLNKEYELSIKNNISFSGVIKNIFKGNNIKTDALISTSIGQVKISNFNFNPKTFNMNGIYAVNLNSLEDIGSFINVNLKGKLNLNGIVKGDKNLLIVTGNTDIANSKSLFTVSLKNFSPIKISLNLNNIKISKLLYMLDYPIYAKGALNINGNLDNVDINNMNLSGKIVTTINNGIMLAKVLNKEFNLKLDRDITFKGKINKIFKGNNLKIFGNLFTSLANLNIPELDINLKSLNISGKYRLNIPNLLKLYPLINTKLRGNAKIDGTIQKSGEKFNITGKSKLFDGDLNFNIDNSLFKLNLSNVKLEKILYMLFYPQMVFSKGNGFFNYDYVKEQGKFDFKFENGKLIKKKLTFIPRTIVGLIYVFTGVDLAKQLYKNINFDGEIIKKIIKYNLLIKSKLVEITSKKSIINLNRETIKSLVNINLKGMNFKILIAGKLNKPSIKFNPSSKSKLPGAKETEKVKKELKKEKEKIKNIFKSLLPK